MIAPKFREVMFRMEVGKYALRLWISTEYEAGISVKLLQLEEKITLDNPATVDSVERILLAHFVPEDRIAAYEILSKATLNGIVGYVEWP